MATSERVRHKLRDGLRQAIGEENAGNLMEMLPPFPWHEVAKKSDVAEECGKIREEMVARFEMVDARFERINARFDKVDARFDKVDARFEMVDARFDKVDARFSDVDARLRGLYPRIVVTNLLMMIALCGLLLGAIKIGV